MSLEIFLGEPPADIKQWIINHTQQPAPVAPNGKVLYKTSADGEWLQSDADIEYGVFFGFNEYESAVAVILPSKDASGNDVTIIGEEIFYYCTGLTSITIPDSVTSIGQKAFSFCSSLMSVTIPNNVETIEYYAFSNCTSLTSVTIPDTTMNIENNAFNECTSLTSVTITANGGNSENVKQMMIAAGVSSDIEWIMPD